MAGRRNEQPLSKEEQEEEELRNELTKFECYDKNMSKAEMKELVIALKQSETEMNDSHSQYVQGTSHGSSANDIQQPQKSMDTSENILNRPLPSFSYRNAAVSNNLTSDSSENQLSNKEKSPEIASNKFYGKNKNETSNSDIDNESIYESPSFKENYPLLRSKSNVKNNTDISKIQTPQTRKPRVTPAMLKRMNMERWRLNPWKFIDEDSIPLKQPEHLSQDESLSYKNEDIDSDAFEELCQQMRTKLDNLHKKFTWDSPTRDSKWGAPIKVGKNWNGSLEKNSLVSKPSPCNSQSPDMPVGGNHERASKRKALNTIAAVMHNQSNDENSDDEFVNTKKRKFQQGKKAEETRRNQESQKNKVDTNNIEMIEDNSKDILDVEFDNSDLHNLRKSSVNSESIKEQLEYPRRIVPPNPGKKNFKGPRAKKNTNQSQKNIPKKDDLGSDEILNALNEEIGDNDCVAIFDTMKDAPPPSRSIQSKIQNARSHLEIVRITEEEKVKAEKEARKQKEKEEEMKKDELISKRLQEEEDEKQRKLDKERKLQEQESFYRDVMNLRNAQAQRVTRSNYNKLKQSSEEIDENVLLDGDDDEPTITHTNLNSKFSPCPICQKSFPLDKIESHASECDAFSSESDEVNTQQPSSSYSRNDSYECFICNNYRTYDGNEFEDHSAKCKELADDRRNGVYRIC